MKMTGSDGAAAPSGDEGFSLVEAVVALAIATAIFTALAFALVGAAKSALLSQQNQQAGDVLNQAVEQARALSYEALTMRTADLNTSERTGAGRTPTIASCLCYNPTNDTTAGAGVEPLVTPDPNGGLLTHVTQSEQNGGTYTIRRYVTRPADASGAVYKRLTVVVTWSTLGRDRVRTYSTLVAATKRGLPLPDFKFTNASSLGQCRNPGSNAVYTFAIKNNGARDAWNLSTTPATPAWTFYADTDGDGLFDAADDAALTVTGGVPTTGLLEPTTSRTFFGVQPIGTGLPLPYALATSVRATSAAQPTYHQSLLTTTTVQLGACGATAPSPTPSASASPTPAPPTAPAQPVSCPALTLPVVTLAPQGTLVRYYPENPDQPGDTLGALDMPIIRDGGVPLAAGDLYNYSTELHTATAGRYIELGATTTARHVASWTYGMPAKSVLRGLGEVTLWAGPANGSPLALSTLRIKLEQLTSAGVLIAQLATVDYVAPVLGWGCTGLRPLPLPIVDIATGNGTTINKDEKLRLSVTVLSGAPVRLGYGTAAYPMTMTLPYKSGLG